MQKKDLRREFLDFFQSKGHCIYDSMPLVPDDASLLFTNSGMVQFKDIFTGKIPIPQTPKATSSQLCIRAGGKHNDLENVGYTARHHTLFEMLGNFSFGDYFKEEAIDYAWEFVTQKLGFDPSLLYITVHDSDDEAFKLWCKHVNPNRIKRMGDKDNFWQMGDTGPCGPCSEIYVDQGEQFFNTSEDYFGGEGDRFLEIWNLVFMQYEQKDGLRTPLPKPSIDTGMGLERVVALLEGKINNFDTSLFASIMSKIESLTGQKYYHDDEILRHKSANNKNIQSTQASFRAIADHARSVGFLLAQGVNFDKEGRGYVLRRILRRALRHGYLLGLKDAFLYQVIETLSQSMSHHYSYLLERKDAILEQCKNEEERFFETIENGMNLFNKECEKTSHVFDGAVAFKLYDTYGFPLDLTQDMLREKNIQIDIAAFDACMQEQKTKAKASWKGSGDSLKEGDFKLLLSELGENRFIGYDHVSCESKILALLDSNFKHTTKLSVGEEGFVMLDQTPFYPESGGPIGDKGKLSSSNQIVALIQDTQKYFGLNLSRILAQTELKVNDSVVSEVDCARLEIAKHHSATHLLHLALRQTLGSHIAQAGSLVEADRLRFDFSHHKAISSQELEEIEMSVNAQILAGSDQICEHLPINEAKAKGAMALFGEKYGQNVRVISFGESIELCGGIHVQNTTHIGSFYIIKESGVSSGVRRIEAVCGKAAYLYGKEALRNISEAKHILKSQDLLQGIAKLKETNKELKTKIPKTTLNTKTLDFETIKETKLIVLQTNESNIKEIIDRVKNENNSVAILLMQEHNGKIALAAGVKNAPLKAGVWVKEIAQLLGGNGGGKDDFATAGGKEITKINEALTLAKQIAQEHLT